MAEFTMHAWGKFNLAICKASYLAMVAKQNNLDMLEKQNSYQNCVTCKIKQGVKEDE